MLTKQPGQRAVYGSSRITVKDTILETTTVDLIQRAIGASGYAFCPQLCCSNNLSRECFRLPERSILD